MQGSWRHAFLLPATVAVVAALGVIAIWQSLREDHETRIANVAEATSYATRSELARRLIVQFQSLRRVADAWMSTAGGAPISAADQAALDLIRFEGVDTIAWSDSDGARFLASGSNPILGHVPSSEEWDAVRRLIAEAYAADGETARGPFVDADGHAIFHYYLPLRRTMSRGALVAVIDAQDLLEALLIDEALGYSVTVSCCDGVELFRRDEADDSLPSTWEREGWIAPADGILWNVAHRPTPRLAEEFTTAGIDSVLIVGLVLSLLLGGLVFETRRANERTKAALSAEQRIRSMNRELEERVVARTSDLSDVLTDLNTINLSVSHDLRSPLNAISLLVSQLGETQKADPVASERCARIDSNIERMVSIMARLLGYSRASSFDSEFAAIDMQSLVEQVVREQSVPPSAVSISAMPEVRGDRVLIHILLSNLIANAVKHGKAGHNLRIEVGSNDSPSDVPTFFVRDNGRGLNRELADQLFKPLTRAKEFASGDVDEGLGIGLAIAARVVERHGGKICVESEPGRGATFRFTLQAPPELAT